MGFAYLVPPVVSPDRDSVTFSQDDGPSDGSGSCLGALYTMTNMAIVVPVATKILKLAHCSESASVLAWSLEPHPLGMLQEKSVVTASLMAGRGR